MSLWSALVDGEYILRLVTGLTILYLGGDMGELFVPEGERTGRGGNPIQVVGIGNVRFCVMA